MVELAKTHGPIVYGIILFGLASVVVGALSIALSKNKAGVYAGFAAIALVLATSSVSVVAVMSARITAQKMADSVEPSLREELLAHAHLESVGLAKLGVAFGAIGLLAGAVGLVRSLVSEDKKAPPSTSEGAERTASWMRAVESNIGLAGLVLSGLALFSVVGAGMPFLVKPPTGSAARGDPERRLVDATRMLEDGRFDDGCTALEQAFADGVDAKQAGVNNVESLVGECFEQKLGKAESGIAPAERTRILTALQETKLPLGQAQRDRVRQALGTAPAK